MSTWPLKLVEVAEDDPTFEVKKLGIECGAEQSAALDEEDRVQVLRACPVQGGKIDELDPLVVYHQDGIGTKGSFCKKIMFLPFW